MYHVTHWLPGAIVEGQRQPAMPCPDLLTEDEAIRYLRLDELKDPKQSFTRKRREIGLQAVALSKSYVYRRIDLERMIELCMETKPR